MLRSSTIDEPGARWRLPDGSQLERLAELPLVQPRVTLLTERSATATAVLLPSDHDGSPLPVLLDPYGGPHAQRVVRSYNAFLSSQWFADQGLAVIVADGRGTPGRGSGYERAVLHDLATGVLDDQIAALHQAADAHPELDLGRVAIRGWSFGGYLAALAVLRRPDVFHAAIAGAPVTEWCLYDTHYTERYLGTPQANPEGYRRSGVLHWLDGIPADKLLLVHGMADDNVLFANSTKLMAALQQRGTQFELMTYPGGKHGLSTPAMKTHVYTLIANYFRRKLQPQP